MRRGTVSRILNNCMPSIQRKSVVAPYDHDHDENVSVATAPCSAPRLPTELIDNIIDCLQDDKPSLANCSLVCHAWLSRSSTYLFHLLSTPSFWPYKLKESMKKLPDGSVYEELQNFLLVCPRAAGNVQELKLWSPSGHTNSSSLPEDIFLAIIGSLPKLQALELDAWAIVPPKDPPSSSISISLNKLVLHSNQGQYHTIIDVLPLFNHIDFLEIQPTLQYRGMHRVSFRVKDDKTTKRVSVGSLTVTKWPARVLSMFLNSLQNLLDPDGLLELRLLVDEDPMESVEPLNSFLIDMGRNIRSMQLPLGEHLAIHSSAPLSFAPCVKLERIMITVKVQIPSNSSFRFTAWPDSMKVLRTAPSLNFIRINLLWMTITKRVQITRTVMMDALRDLEWAALDSVVEGCSGLKVIELQAPKGISSDDVEMAITAGLSPSSRALLRIL